MTTQLAAGTTVVGRYRIIEELGRGANTVVYRSYDLSLGREVAIKQLDENSRLDPRQRERFLREAQFLAQQGAELLDGM